MLRTKNRDLKPSPPAWVVTFGDMMTLLLTFFVLLLTLTSIDEPTEYAETVQAIRGAFGILPRHERVIDIRPTPTESRTPSEGESDLAQSLRRKLQALNLDETVRVDYDTPMGIKISLPASLLFEEGATELKDESSSVIEELGTVLAAYPQSSYEIRGHVSDPSFEPSAEMQDEYDFSYARAAGVARRLNDHEDIDRSQLVVVACGASQPLSPNTSPEGRAANRRVDIHVRGLLRREDVRTVRSRTQSLTNR